MNYRKIAASLCLVLALNVPLAYADIDSKKDDLKEAEQKADKAKDKISEVKEEKKNVESELDKLESKINETNKELSTIESNIASIQTNINKTKDEIEKTQNGIDEKNELVSKRLRAMYKTGNNISYIHILLSSESIGDLVKNVKMIQTITKNDQELLEEMENEKKVLKAKEDKLVSQEKQLKLQTVQLNNKKNELQLASREKNKIISKLDQTIQRSEKEHESLIAESNKIASEIKQLEAEARRKLEEQKKQQESQSNGDSGNGNNTPAPNTNNNSSHIWPTPGNGRITSPYGNRLHPISGTYKMHTGIDIGAPSGSTVVAVKSGIVIESRYKGSYGNTVMITHDDGTTSLYAHNSSLLVSKGQYVKQGQTIARVGSTGASTGPHLHFEIRVNGNHRNPLNYVRR